MKLLFKISPFENVRIQYRITAFAGEFKRVFVLVKILLLFFVSNSSNQQLLLIKRRSQPIVRSSSVHDLNRHEVYRANELDFGPIIGQGFYGIARTVNRIRLRNRRAFVRLSLGYTQENWSDNGNERNKNI